MGHPGARGRLRVITGLTGPPAPVPPPASAPAFALSLSPVPTPNFTLDPAPTTAPSPVNPHVLASNVA